MLAAAAELNSEALGCPLDSEALGCSFESNCSTGSWADACDVEEVREVSSEEKKENSEEEDEEPFIMKKKKKAIMKKKKKAAVSIPTPYIRDAGTGIPVMENMISKGSVDLVGDLDALKNDPNREGIDVNEAINFQFCRHFNYPPRGRAYHPNSGACTYGQNCRNVHGVPIRMEDGKVVFDAEDFTHLLHFKDNCFFKGRDFDFQYLKELFDASLGVIPESWKKFLTSKPFTRKRFVPKPKTVVMTAGHNGVGIPASAKWAKHAKRVERSPQTPDRPPIDDKNGGSSIKLSFGTDKPGEMVISPKLKEVMAEHLQVTGDKVEILVYMKYQGQFQILTEFTL